MKSAALFRFPGRYLKVNLDYRFISFKRNSLGLAKFFIGLSSSIQ